MAETHVDIPVKTMTTHPKTPANALLIMGGFLVTGVVLFVVGMVLIFELGMGLPGTILLFLSTPVLVISIPQVADPLHVLVPTIVLICTMIIRGAVALTTRVVPNLKNHALVPDCASRAPLWGSGLGAYFETVVTLVAVTHLIIVATSAVRAGAITHLNDAVWKTTAKYMLVLGILCGQIIIAGAAADSGTYGANGEFVGPTVVGLVLLVCATFLWNSRIHGPVRSWVKNVGGAEMKETPPELGTTTEYFILMGALSFVLVLAGFGITAFLTMKAQAAC